MSQEKTDFTNLSVQRPNYFPGQYLLEDDFELQHKYLSDRQKYYNQSLHVSGIIKGLEVEVVKNKKVVQIKSGSALDSQGNLIVLNEDKTFNDFKSIAEGVLCIEYMEEKQERQQDKIDKSYRRWREQPRIKFVAIDTAGDGIKLAKLTVNKDDIALDTEVREYSGISLPDANGKALTLRAEGDNNPNMAVLSGSLKIDGDLAIRGNIELPDYGREIQLIKAVASGDVYSWGTISSSSYSGITIGIPDLAFGGFFEIGSWNTKTKEDREFKQLFHIDGQGNTKINAGLTVAGAITPSVGKTETNGIMFPKNPGGGDSDAAWIRYYSRETNGEATTLEIGTSNDVNDHIALMPKAGNVGIGTANPSQKLEVNGNIKATNISANGNLTVTGTISGKIDAKKIISGTLNVDRIPNLSANKITSETLHVDRIPKLSANKITSGKIQGSLSVTGAITPSVGNSSDNGIMFPRDPGGGSGDAAWIRYYRRGTSGEATTLEIGTSDGTDDHNHIALMPKAGNVGIGLNNPTEKLEVDGNIKAKDVLASGNLVVDGTIYAGSTSVVAYKNYEICLSGSALESSDGGDTSNTFLKIANIDIKIPHETGINTAILQPNGTYKDKQHHDVHANADDWNTWANWIETNASSDDVIAVASYDAIGSKKIPTDEDGSAQKLLKSIGAKFVDRIGDDKYKNDHGRNSFALLFIKGKSTCLEVFQPYKGENARLETTYHQLLSSNNNKFLEVNGGIKAQKIKIGSTEIDERQLRFLKRIASGELEVDLLNTNYDEYLYASEYKPIDNNRRRVFTAHDKKHIAKKSRWKLKFPE